MRDTDSEEEKIIVTRQEEEVDPEDEADFEREYAKMMAESLESRKFDRKPTFDVPLPMRRKERDINNSSEMSEETAPANALPTGTMAFSLLTKRGNRQTVSFLSLFLTMDSDGNCQTKTVSLPSDSNFAIAMKTQQAAEKEEQQRIKSLVLNYDLRDVEEQDGDSNLASLVPNSNIKQNNTGPGKTAAVGPTRFDKSGSNRSGQRARKLQLTDIDWYDSRKNFQSPNIAHGDFTDTQRAGGQDDPEGPDLLSKADGLSKACTGALSRQLSSTSSLQQGLRAQTNQLSRVGGHLSRDLSKDNAPGGPENVRRQRNR